MNSSKAVLFPVPAMPERKMFPPACIMSTARCCSGSSLVVDDAAFEEMDDDGEESGFRVVRAEEVSAPSRNNKLTCDSCGFMVAVI